MMIDALKALFSYDFLLKAVVVGSLVSLCASLLGVSLVLKHYSMLGDGLSHVAFGTLSVALALRLSPLQVSIPVVMLAAFLLLRISQNGRINGDAAVALISSSSLAIGVFVTSLSSGMNIDVFHYMFGSILAMSSSDVYISLAVSAAVIILFILFYNKIFAVTFDESFAKASGVNSDIYNMLIALLTAVTVVIGMRVMGALLISSLIIFPSLTAMRVFRSFRGVVICSAVTSVICFFFGMAVSYAFSAPAGASVVIVNLAVFLLFSLSGLLFIRKS